jgi:LPS export ABC transporter protein LptC
VHKMLKNIPAYLFLLIIVVITGVFSSCENDIQTVNKISNIKELPSFSANNFEMLYSDSGKIRMKLTTKLAKRFNLPDKQYWEFPKGIIVYQYDSAKQVTSTIKANYAIYRDNIKLWQARSNVEAKNLLKKEELFTEELFWDQSLGIIYSTKFTKIITDTKVLYGDKGFQSKEDMSDWKLFGAKGKVTINDNITENEEQNP